ncbi:hypothetical protein ATCC90586_005028 [Pythium insidiosum]|nr:hypothetical protein ATCC90586_005028 [Pythium insidiosum]
MYYSDDGSARETWGSLKIEVRYARGLPPSREDPETHRSTPCKYAVRICAGGITKITRYVACDDQGCIFKETLRFDIATAYTTSPVVIEVLRQGDSALNFCSESVELHEFNRFLPDIPTTYTTSPVVFEVLRQGDDALNVCSVAKKLDRIAKSKFYELSMPHSVQVDVSCMAKLKSVRRSSKTFGWFYLVMPKATTVSSSSSAHDANAAAVAASPLWQCPICLDTLVAPMLTTCCGQSFCQACLDAALAKVDACPMCRAPLLAGATHTMTRNRALEDILSRMQHTDASERHVLIAIGDEADAGASGSRVDEDKRTRRGALTQRVRALVLSCATRTRHLTLGVTQWRHWCRVHWATLQCVFYVWLFGVFVFFLRVQEEEFAEHSNR